MQIEIIGSGCKKCKMLYEIAQDVAKDLNIGVSVLYSTDITKIINMGLVSSPIMTINGNPVLVGVLPTKEELKEIISKNI